MKSFISWSELVSVLFKKNSQAVTLRPNQTTTYTASRDVQLPQQDSDAVLVSRNSTDTLTNKTLTSPAITTPSGIVKGDVGLGNVDNTSDATKNTAAATLTNKTLTAPVINSPTGIVKGDVGLGNVDNTSDATKNSASATLTNKTLTSPVINGSLSGTAIVNETNMASNSSTLVPTQSSVKAYVDSAVSAAGNVAYSAKSADYTVTTSDAIRTIGMTTGASNRTVTLPAAASSTNRIITIKKVDSGVGRVIVDGNASETIDGALTNEIVSQYGWLTLQCDGTGWTVLDVSDSINLGDGTLDGSWTSGVFADIGTMSLPAGYWVLKGGYQFDVGSATSPLFYAAISTTSGNSATGQTLGVNQFLHGLSNSGVVEVPAYDVQITTTTTHYLKKRANYGGSAPSRNGYYFKAVRLR